VATNLEIHRDPQDHTTGTLQSLAHHRKANQTSKPTPTSNINLKQLLSFTSKTPKTPNSPIAPPKTLKRPHHNHHLQPPFRYSTTIQNPCILNFPTHTKHPHKHPLRIHIDQTPQLHYPAKETITTTASISGHNSQRQHPPTTSEHCTNPSRTKSTCALESFSNPSPSQSLHNHSLAHTKKPYPTQNSKILHNSDRNQDELQKKTKPHNLPTNHPPCIPHLNDHKYSPNAINLNPLQKPESPSPPSIWNPEISKVPNHQGATSHQKQHLTNIFVLCRYQGNIQYQQQRRVTHNVNATSPNQQITSKKIHTTNKKSGKQFSNKTSKK
jgi:hypothetical protein